MPRLLLNWKKNHHVMVFILIRNSTLKFQFVFGFNECLLTIFFLLNLKISGFIFGLWLHGFLILRHKWLQVTSLYPIMPMNKKLECKEHQIYSKMLRKICKKEIKPQFHQSQKKFILWSTFSVSMVQTFLKLLLVSSATLLCKTWNISIFSI